MDILEFRKLRPWNRHSTVLVGAGLCYIFIGIAYLFIIPGGPRYKALEIAINVAPLGFYSALFILVGLASIISARWPVMSEKWGYTALTALSSGWAAVYFLGTIIGDPPTTNLTSGATWALVAFLWWGVSGLVDPDDIKLGVLPDGYRD